jgi:hypothetical protein
MQVNPRDESNGKVRGVAATSAQQVTEPRRATGTDSVRLSGELRLADEAVRAAALAAEVRPDAVARARALLESGELGRDVSALADSIIDSLLESRDPRP